MFALPERDILYGNRFSCCLSVNSLHCAMKSCLAYTPKSKLIWQFSDFIVGWRRLAPTFCKPMPNIFYSEFSHSSDSYSMLWTTFPSLFWQHWCRPSPVFPILVRLRLFDIPAHVLLARCPDYMSGAHQTSLLTNDLVNDEHTHTASHA